MKYIFSFLFSLISIISFSQTKQYPNIDISYKKFVLDNGLTLIVHEDHKLPIAAFNIWYHVGSKNEKPGKTGFAHLFEHIMFTSTEHWSNFDEVMQTVGGGNNNGTTNNDRTNYFETFTNTGLERVLWVEADRMGFLLKGLDSAKIEVQRGVVQNEKRQGENQPYAISNELTVKATYPEGHPYSWTVIGSMDDLSAASVDDVKEWFKTYYGPNNAFIAIAGDVNTDEVLQLVKKYFGEIPPSPPIVKFTNNIAKMKGTIIQQAQDRVPQARLQNTWNVPGWGTKESSYLSMLGEILTSGKSSRLYKRLVLDEDLVTDVSFYLDDKEIGGQFYLFTDAKPGVSLSKINDIIDQELQKILTSGVTEEELERSKTNFFVQLLNNLETLGGFGGKSDWLAMSETYGGSPDAYKKILDYTKAATPNDIKNVAHDWLTDGEYILEINPYEDYKTDPIKVDRTIMPPVSKAAPAKFPQIKSFSLSNGAQVYLAERHDLPLVNIMASFNGGSSVDIFSNAGTAKMTGTMLSEGTTTKTAIQISDLLSTMGSTLNSSSSIDNMTVRMSCLKTHFDASMNLFSDVILHPSFPVKEFERVKKEQLLRIEQEKASPNLLGARILPQLIYPVGDIYNTPLTGSGTIESSNKISRNDLIKYHQTWFVPNNAIIVAVGDITESELKTTLEISLKGWKSQKTPLIPVSNTAKLPTSPVVYIIDKPDAIQSQLFAAEISLSAEDKDIDAFNLMNHILGGTFLSRLNMNLREDKHWSYGAGSYLRPVKGKGMFVATAGVQTDKTKESIEEILKELTQITTTKKIGKEEFENEQNSTILSLPDTWQTNNGIMNFLFNAILFNRGIDYPEKYATILQQFKISDIQQVANKVIKPNSLTWLIIGDRKKIEKGIRELNIGPVKIINSNGSEIK